MKREKKYEKPRAPTWIAILIITFVILMTFFFFMSEGYCNWISREIPNREMRTVVTGFLQAIIVALVLGTLFEFCIIHYDRKKQDAMKISDFV